MPFYRSPFGSVHYNTPSNEPTPAPVPPAPAPTPAPVAPAGKTYTQAELEAELAKVKPADVSGLQTQLANLQRDLETEQNARKTIERQQAAARREDAKRAAFKNYLKATPTLAHLAAGENADDHLDTMVAKFDKVVPGDAGEDKFAEHAKAIADGYAKLVAVPQPGGPPAPQPGGRPPAPSTTSDVANSVLNQLSYNPRPATAVNAN